ncbi:molybdopterin molybdotransferase MoeA [Leifsonia xyli]|uniref:molybdopterin molybdotransferase MoeA n=1 Tax=Leifsonia xyli TaxID=1575 RepID=UPI003D679D11
MHPEQHTVESYREAVLSLASALPAETVGLADALRRTTAEPVRARHALPRFDNAAMDGYAVCAADVAGAAPDRPATLVRLSAARAGAARPAPLRRGEARPVMTGAPLPPGAELVVPVECTTTGSFCDDETVALWPTAKTNVRRRGEDLAEGATVVGRGMVLGPRDLALLAATGRTSVVVHRRPRIAVIATGDELSARAGAGCGVPDSNSVYLCAAVATLGGTIASTQVVPDDEDALSEALDAAAREADLILSTGGVGPGTHDLAGQLTAAAPGGMLARVAMRPGRPQGHARWGGTPWLALPGNPTAVLVSFEAFVRPVLLRLAGCAPDSVTGAETVSVGWSGSPGVVRFVPLAVADGADTVSVTPLGPPGHAAHSLSAMFRAPLIAIVGAETGDVRPGQLVPVIEPA